MPAMAAAHSNPFNLLVDGIASPKIVTLVNKIIEVKQIIPIKISQPLKPACWVFLEGVASLYRFDSTTLFVSLKFN